MKKMTKWMLLPLFAVLAFVACSDSEETVPPYLKVTTVNGSELKAIAASATAFDINMIINSNVDWTISIPEDASTRWFDVAPSSGEAGETVVKVTVKENKSIEPRSSYLNISATGVETIKIEVSQSNDNIAFAVTEPTDKYIPVEGGEVSYAISTNLPLERWSYKVEVAGDQAAVAKYEEVSKTNEKLTLKFAENEGESEIDYNVVFTYDGNTLTKSLTQKAKEKSDIVADLLDVVFNADGTATDVSPMNHKVETYPSAKLTTYYNEDLRRQVAKFDNDPYTSVYSGYYNIPYEANDKFINDIADGCTFETIFRINKEHVNSKELKWFSSMQGGGIGYLLCSGTTDDTKSICFLPNISTTGASNWLWTRSGRVARVGQFYHVVGVYDKVKGTSAIYINGELYNEVLAPGNYVPVGSAGARRFTIGGDATSGTTGCEASINGEVAMARIYSRPLSADNVATLWKNAEFEVDKSTIDIYKVQFLPNVRIAAGYKYKIYGRGFEQGDKIMFKLIGETEMEATFDSEKATVTIPSNFRSGQYEMTVVRGDQRHTLGTAQFQVVPNPKFNDPKIIAHRGIHITGETENSRGSLREAMKFNCYGSELDVHATKDGRIVVHHDGVVGSQVFQNCTYDEIKNIRLANGETLPTLEDMFTVVNQYKSTSQTKMIIEFKTGAEGLRAVPIVMNMVEEAGLKDRVEYISFGYDICKAIVQRDKKAMVGYLNGNYAPSVCHADGIMSIDYNSGVFDKNIGWITDAQNLGMIVNVWTISDDASLMKFIGLGVDYITTDQPMLCKDLIDKKFIEKP